MEIWVGFAQLVGGAAAVIENATNEVATKVDMKAGKLTKKEGPDFASQPDKVAKGLRLALLPQGTWFVPRKDNEWKAQIEVDGTSGARQVWVPESDAPGAPRTRYQLFPKMSAGASGARCGSVHQTSGTQSSASLQKSSAVRRRVIGTFGTTMFGAGGSRPSPSSPHGGPRRRASEQ